jgi:hypothetical protein
MVSSPPHTADADPSALSSRSRARIKGDICIVDDDKAVRVHYSKLLTDPSRPPRLTLGHGIIPRALDQWENNKNERTAW